jgi:hypothetical protein
LGLRNLWNGHFKDSNSRNTRHFKHEAWESGNRRGESILFHKDGYETADE